MRERLHKGTTAVGASDSLWATDRGTDDAARRMDRVAAAVLFRDTCAERFGSVE